MWEFKPFTLCTDFEFQEVATHAELLQIHQNSFKLKRYHIRCTVQYVKKFCFAIDKIITEGHSQWIFTIYKLIWTCITNLLKAVPCGTLIQIKIAAHVHLQKQADSKMIVKG